MFFLWGLALVLLAVSFFSDRQKTLKALIIAKNKLIRILPAFSVLLIFVSLALTIFSKQLISSVLAGENLWFSSLSASLIGSVAFMPGFVTFPLCGILRENGVAMMTLSAFSSTLMMVGIVTFPLEKEYLGFPLAVLRNISGFLTAVIIALLTGFLFGEIL